MKKRVYSGYRFKLWLWILSVLIVAQIPGVVSAVMISGTGGAPTCPVFIGPAIIDFDSAPTGVFNSTVIGNVKFSGLDGGFEIGPAYIGQYNTVGVNSLHNLPNGAGNPILPSIIQMQFTIPVSAFAFNWGAADNLWQMDAYDSSNALIESDSVLLLPNSSTNLGEYFGIAAADIKRVVMTDQKDNYANGDEVFIDNFTTSFESNPVPEPGSISALACALAWPGIMRRRRGIGRGRRRTSRRSACR